MKLALLLLCAAVAAAQDFSQRGFLESSLQLYPQTAPNDSAHAVDESLFRYEAFYKPSASWRFAGGFDARMDTHQETDRDAALSWWDRERLRPAFEVRRLSATYAHGKLTIEAASSSSAGARPTS